MDDKGRKIILNRANLLRSTRIFSKMKLIFLEYCEFHSGKSHLNLEWTILFYFCDNYQNPFVKIITKKQEYRSSISKAAEKKPEWNYTELIEVEEGENIRLQILDFNSRSEPELIAETILTSQELLGCILKKDVCYQHQVVGQIELQTQNKTIKNWVQEIKIPQVKNIIPNTGGAQFQYP